MPQSSLLTKSKCCHFKEQHFAKERSLHVAVCRIASVTLLALCVLAQCEESAWDKNLGGSLAKAFLRFDVDLLLESKSEEAQKQIESAPGGY